jgi:hypothetical protein
MKIVGSYKTGSPYKRIGAHPLLLPRRGTLFEMREAEERTAMGANQFFTGLLAGLAMLAVPLTVLGFGGNILEFPDRLGAWINEPGSHPANPSVAYRPVNGYVPGAPTIEPTPQSLPNLHPIEVPTPVPPPPTAAVAAPPSQGYIPSANGWAQAVVTGAGGQPIPLRRAIGVNNATDPILQPGAMVLLSPYGVIRLNGQEWHSVRTPEGAIGWLPADAIAPPGTLPSAVAAAPAAATAGPARLRVANTDGEGVVFRASPRLDDRTSAALAEGATVTVLETSGTDWVRVHADSGQEGWLPTQYLVPAS